MCVGRGTSEAGQLGGDHLGSWILEETVHRLRGVTGTKEPFVLLLVVTCRGISRDADWGPFFTVCLHKSACDFLFTWFCFHLPC